MGDACVGMGDENVAWQWVSQVTIYYSNDC